MTPTIDLNSDLGESYGAWQMGDDAALLEIVSSANLACGFHAGDPLTMMRAVMAAKARDVRIGAHVSYPDLAGFGRRDMEIAPEALRADVLYQIGALQGMARAAGTRVAYVKPHGALYNRISHDPLQAQAVLAAMAEGAAGLPLVVLAGSPLMGWAAAAGVTTIAEAFADRAVLPNGQLAPRGQAGAVLTDVDAIASRVVRLVQSGEVEAIGGARVKMAAQSICLHGDTPGAVAIARAVAAALGAAGIPIRAFA